MWCHAPAIPALLKRNGGRDRRTRRKLSSQLKPASLEQLHKSENNKGDQHLSEVKVRRALKRCPLTTQALCVHASVLTHTNTKLQTDTILTSCRAEPPFFLLRPLPWINSMEMPYFATCFCLSSSIASPLPFPEKTPIRHFLTLVCEPAAFTDSTGRQVGTQEQDHLTNEVCPIHLLSPASTKQMSKTHLLKEQTT